MIKLTKEGKQQLEQKLARLQSETLIEASKRVNEARKFCDFSEDPMYVKFVDESNEVREEIERLKHILKHAHIVESVPNDTVGLGSLVTICELPDGDEETYRLVSPIEANIDEGLISTESPLGQQLIDQQEGATIELGDLSFRIVNITNETTA